PPLAGSTVVGVQEGNVNAGAFDPGPAVCARARDAGSWVHVDGACGIWAAAAPGRAHLAAGLALADSWATDGHKWLNVPYDCGVVLVRDPRDLEAAMSASAAYLAQGAARHPFRNTPEMSRRARGVEVWAALRSLGRAGLAELIERTSRHASPFAHRLPPAPHSRLSQALAPFGDAETSNRVIAAIQEDGTCWCGGTVWQGHTAMRISVSSWATTEDDVERSLAAMLRVAGRATAPGVSRRPEDARV